MTARGRHVGPTGNEHYDAHGVIEIDCPECKYPSRYHRSETSGIPNGSWLKCDILAEDIEESHNNPKVPRFGIMRSTT